MSEKLVRRNATMSSTFMLNDKILWKKEINLWKESSELPYLFYPVQAFRK